MKKMALHLKTWRLNEIPVIFICPDHNPKYHERRIHMESLLKRLNFQSVDMFQSSAEAYPLCLLRAHYDVLRRIRDHNGPYLVLEDDVEITKWYTEDISWPEDTDAFYLGLSKCGASYKVMSHGGPSNIDHVTNQHIQIQNMLALHAVVYVSQRYKDACMKALEGYLQSANVPCDVLIARLHKDFRVFANYRPHFYQTKRLGNSLHVQNMTYFEFEKTVTLVTAFYPLAKSKHGLQTYMSWASIFFRCVTVPIVCYCDKQAIHSLQKLAGSNVTFQVRPFESWPYSQQEWMTRWASWWASDPEKDRHSPELYAIWASKLSFVQQTIRDRESDVYVWCDIGAFRSARPGHFKYIWQHVVQDKITCLRLYDSYDKTMTIGGGILAGNAKAFQNFQELYDKELNRDINGKDQRIFRRILDTSNANIIDAPQDMPEWKQWFYLTYLFSDEAYLF
jgi:hypothetical protein